MSGPLCKTMKRYGHERQSKSGHNRALPLTGWGLRAQAFLPRASPLELCEASPCVMGGGRHAQLAHGFRAHAPSCAQHLAGRMGRPKSCGDYLPDLAVQASAQHAAPKTAPKSGEAVDGGRPFARPRRFLLLDIQAESIQTTQIPLVEPGHDSTAERSEYSASAAVRRQSRRRRQLAKELQGSLILIWYILYVINTMHLNSLSCGRGGGWGGCRHGTSGSGLRSCWAGRACRRRAASTPATVAAASWALWRSRAGRCSRRMC